MTTPSSRTTAPSDRLTPAEVRRVFRTSLIAWGFFGSAWTAAVSGIVYVTFIRNKLHASTFMYGLIMVLPILGALGQLLGAYLTETFRRRRLQCVHHADRRAVHVPAGRRPALDHPRLHARSAGWRCSSG